MAESDAEEGTVVLAREQTSGRGTKGRGWHSAKDLGLYLSVILKPRNPRLTLLPLAAGLAVSAAIFKACGVVTVLKWPNDIYVRGKKLGGILIEAVSLGKRVNYAILGIGLNVKQKKEDFPVDLRNKAVSLAMITGKCLDAEELLNTLLDEVGRFYGAFHAGKNAEIIRSFTDRMSYPFGKILSLLTDAGPRTGAFAGLDDGGGLLLDQNGRRAVYYSGEIIGLQAD